MYTAFNWTREKWGYGPDTVRALEKAAQKVGDEIHLFRRGEDKAFNGHRVTAVNPLSTVILPQYAGGVA